MLTNCIRLTLLKPNLKRNHVAYATKNDPSIGSKLELDMKLNSKRNEKTESGMQSRSIRDQNDPSIGSKLEPFMKLNSKT